MSKKAFIRAIRILILVAALIFVMWAFNGCKTQQPVSSVPEVKIEKQIEVPAKKPIVWRQSIFPSITMKDSVLFFNSTEIKLEGAFYNKTFTVVNGEVNLMDSTNAVSRIVPALTSGGWIEVRKDKTGNIGAMLVSFSQEKADYVFQFFRKTDGSFTLNGKAEIVYLGKKYPVTATTSGGECLLMFYFNKTEVRNEIKDVAPGWQLQDQ